MVTTSATAAPVEVPEVTAAFFKTPPVLDGKLDDACWAAAGAARGFRPANPSAALKEQTNVLVGYDASNLYVGFECMESRMGQVRAEYAQDGSSIWLDDAIELFVSPHSAAAVANYVHFGVNVAGAKTAERAADGPTRLAWTARTSRSADRWFVEIAIPFSTLAPLGRNDDCWRVNFCRNEHPSGDAYSAWAPIDSSFHDYWRFGRLLPPANGPGFVRQRGPLRALPPVADAVSRQFSPKTPEIRAADTPIIPAPRQMRALPGRFAITPKTQIVVGDRISSMDRRAAEEIEQEARKALGFRLPIVPAAKMAPGRPAILVGEPWLNARVKRYCASNGRTVTKASPGREGYILDATPSVLVVAGSDQAGTFWGAQTVRQMIRRDARGQGFVRCAQVRDWPRFPYRGVHLLTCSDGLAFHGKCIEEVFSRYKINQIVLEAENVRWDSHPEVFNPARGMSKADVRKLIAIARRHHITVTPLIQSLGHMEWAFYKGANLDLAEDRNTPYAFCPRNEKGYRFMFDIMDEAVELFGRPAYMHIGHDEITNAGRFPVHDECVRIGKHQLYVDDIQRYYQHLKSRGVKTMIWGDVLTQEGYRNQVASLPKDIVVCDWRYSKVKEYPSLDFYKAAGFPLIGCTWCEPENLYNFSVAGAKRNILGMCQTTWTGFLPSQGALATEYYQIYSYIEGAEWAWSPGNRPANRLPYDPELVYARDMGISYKMNAHSRYLSIPIGAFANVSRTDRADSLGWIGLAPGEDLSGLPEGAWSFKGVPFQITPAAIALRGAYPTQGLPVAARGVRVGRKASALHFLQTTAFEAGPGQVVGRYVIHYADGTQAIAPLRYGAEIKHWQDDRSTSASNPAAWRGRTASGQPIALRRFTWTNPSSEKEIETIDFEAADTEAAPILAAITAEGTR
ncbi:MAG TPA: glycoside hydrolase family 20 zincin-like fold domain-containing protein [Armatimonadota bacterium]